MAKPMLPLPHLTDKNKRNFWRKISLVPDENGCLLWTGAKTKARGKVSVGGKMYFAPRIAYFLATGNDPCELYVCHVCDNPACCTPEHLFTGTHADNMRDRDQKGRTTSPRGDKNGSRTHPEKRPRGEFHARAKLTERDIVAIRSDPRTLVSIATSYKVSFGLINHIKRRKIWKHVP